MSPGISLGTSRGHLGDKSTMEPLKLTRSTVPWISQISHRKAGGSKDLIVKSHGLSLKIVVFSFTGDIYQWI